MSRSKRNNRRSDTKNYEAWVSLNHIKDKTGLSIKDIHLILAQKQLWSNRRPTVNAIENRIARYNQTMSRYEWRNSIVTRLVTTYIREGTAEARKQARNQLVQEKRANPTPTHSTVPPVKNFGTKDQPSASPYWLPLSVIQEKTKFSLDEVNFILTKMGAMESGRPSQTILDKKRARQNPDTLKYEWHRNHTLNLINSYVQKADKRWRKEAQQEKRKQASAFKRTTVQTPRPVVPNTALEQGILRIFKEVEETQRQIAGYKIAELVTHSNPHSPYSSKQGLHNDYGYSLARSRPVHIAKYKAFADEHGIKQSINDIICPVCFDDEGVQVPFVYSNLRAGSIHKDGTPYFRHHDYKDFAKNHGAESEWHAAAKDFIRGFVLDYPGSFQITSSENEIRDNNARRVSDVRVEDTEGNVVAFEIQKSRQSDERFDERHSNYSEANIHEQWLYHSGCPKIFGAEDYRHALILDFVPSSEDATSLVETTRVGIVVTKMLPGNRYYTFPIADSELIKKYAIYTPISEWEYSPKGLTPAKGTSAEKLVTLLEKMSSLMDEKDAVKKI